MPSTTAAHIPVNTTETSPLSPRLVPVAALNAISSLIAEGAVFEGAFTAKKDLGLRIDGTLKGSIHIANGGTVHIGPTGWVEDTVIEADHVLIEGKVRGKVVARKTLEITGSATLVGDAAYDVLLDVHPRARIKGMVEFRGDLDAPAGSRHAG
jgi:cytoskeletal protein CcmA (bactofilin family)